MKHHKSKAGTEDCLCKSCKYRFQCFTQERVFSDPIQQGLFEALMAKGRTREQAIGEVEQEIKARMGIQSPDRCVDKDTTPWIPFPYPPSTSAPQPNPPYMIWCGDTISIDDVSGNSSYDGVKLDDLDDVQITCTMSTGEKVSWNAKISELNCVG